MSIYMARELPAGVPMANWLPIPPGAFNIMLRVYGPEGTVEGALTSRRASKNVSLREASA